MSRVLPPKLIEKFFRNSAAHRSAPVPLQVESGLLIRGDSEAAKPVRQAARQVLEQGPEAISPADLQELRYDLTLLEIDLAYAMNQTRSALAATAHHTLSKAILDLNQCWRAERKALRAAVAKVDPQFAQALDTALLDAWSGDVVPMKGLCRRMLDSIGGAERTYPKFRI